MEILVAAACGLILDLLLGDPAWMPHPVVAMGRGITALEKVLRRIFPKTPRGELAGGVVMAALLPCGTLAVSILSLWLCGLVPRAAFFARRHLVLAGARHKRVAR